MHAQCVRNDASSVCERGLQFWGAGTGCTLWGDLVDLAVSHTEVVSRSETQHKLRITFVSFDCESFILCERFGERVPAVPGEFRFQLRKWFGVLNRV